VYVAKCKVMKVTKTDNVSELDISLNGIRMKAVQCFRYFGVDINRDGSMKSEMKHRVTEGKKVSGVLRKIWKGEGMSRDARRSMYECMVEPTLLYIQW
jgi:hypothetical protein